VVEDARRRGWPRYDKKKTILVLLFLITTAHAIEPEEDMIVCDGASYIGNSWFIAPNIPVYDYFNVSSADSVTVEITNPPNGTYYTSTHDLNATVSPNDADCEYWIHGYARNAYTPPNQQVTFTDGDLVVEVECTSGAATASDTIAIEVYTGGRGGTDDVEMVGVLGGMVYFVFIVVGIGRRSENVGYGRKKRRERY